MPHACRDLQELARAQRDRVGVRVYRHVPGHDEEALRTGLVYVKVCDGTSLITRNLMFTPLWEASVWAYQGSWWVRSNSRVSMGVRMRVLAV
jgi:hypothetical protein